MFLHDNIHVFCLQKKLFSIFVGNLLFTIKLKCDFFIRCHFNVCFAIVRSFQQITINSLFPSIIF